jgi:photosystem II stability/assembly factor-like uncharacterized protein
MLLITRRRLQLSTDLGKTFAAVTPKLTRTDFLRDFDSAGSAAVVSGPRTLLVSGDGRAWKHMRLPPLGHGDDVLLSVDFTGPRTGFVLTAFHRLFRTRDAGHHWTELLGNAGAGISLAMSDGRNGWIAAPGFGNRYDGAVLATSDGGATWRPQIVAPRFVSKVAAAGGTGYLVGNEGSALFATSDGGDAGTEVGVGFRPSPRAVRRGRFVTIRGRVTPGEPGRTVAVSMRSARRWIVRSATTGSSGVFQVRFKLARSAVFVAQVPSDATHRGAGTRPVLVRVTR